MQETSGELAEIYIAATCGAPMQAVTSVQTIAERGLEGDRYAAGKGTFSNRFEVAPGARALSLIDAASVALCAERLQCSINPALLRRNVLVNGLDLMALRGWTLHVGDVRIELVGSCPPCRYLARLLDRDVRAGLRGIGGMRARIVSGGLLTQGQRMTAVKDRRRTTESI